MAEPQTPNTDTPYVLPAHALRRVEVVMNRLYSERKLKNGDEYRDLAQQLQVAIDESFELPT